MKNRYFLLIIDKSLDRLGYTKQFIQLDNICVYHQIRTREDNYAKPCFILDMATLNIRLSLLVFQTLQLAFQDTSTRLLTKN